MMTPCTVLFAAVGGDQQEYRELVEWLKAHRWRVDESRGGYPMAFCPCRGHKKTLHYTPSNPNYWRNARAWFRRCECWED